MKNDQAQPLLSGKHASSPPSSPSRRRQFQRQNSTQAEEKLELLDSVKICCRHDNSKLFFSAFSVIIILCLGGLGFTLLEKDHEIVRIKASSDDRRKILKALGNNEDLFQFIQNHSNAFLPYQRETHWNFDDSVYFSLMIITTLGVADQYPKTTGGQLFCAFYALSCIPLMGLFLMLLGRKIVASISSLIRCCCMDTADRDELALHAFHEFDSDGNGTLDPLEFRKALLEMGVESMEDDEKFSRILLVADMDGDEEIDIDEFKVAVSLTEADLTGAYTRNYRIRIVLVIGLIWCLMGTWAFAYTEGWDYTEGFYFTVTTLTAVGTGDYAPHSDHNYLKVAIFVIAGLGIFSTMLTILATHYRSIEEAFYNSSLKRREQLISNRALSKSTSKTVVEV
jgi:hypothetical protein